MLKVVKRYIKVTPMLFTFDYSQEIKSGFLDVLLKQSDISGSAQSQCETKLVLYSCAAHSSCLGLTRITVCFFCASKIVNVEECLTFRIPVHLCSVYSLCLCSLWLLRTAEKT